MNCQSESHVHPRGQDAFTLLELMVVIGIIALLSALIMSGSVAALRKSRITRVKAERDELVAAIESYKSKVGFYPPDNAFTNPAVPPLFYELMGVATNTSQQFVTKRGSESISFADTQTVFGRGGFANTASSSSSIDPFLKALNEKKFTNLTVGAVSMVSVLTVPVDGPGPVGTPNTWRYVSTNPTNNPKTFDLWAEIVLGGQTTVIGNWKNGQ